MSTATADTTWSTWEQLRAEYFAARADETAASERAEAARLALLRAQCGERYDTTIDDDGKRWAQYCTRPKGHPVDEHGKEPVDRLPAAER